MLYLRIFWVEAQGSERQSMTLLWLACSTCLYGGRALAQGPSLLRCDICQLAGEPVQQAGLLAGQALLLLRDTMPRLRAGKTRGKFTTMPNPR